MSAAEPTALRIRLLERGDAVVMSSAFAEIGWRKPVELYQRYLREQDDRLREILVGFVGGEFAGHVCVVQRPAYWPLAEQGIPEIQDLNA